MTIRRLSLLFACLFLNVSAGWAENWGHYQHDNAHTGRSTAAVKPAKLQLAWSAEGYTNALILGDTVYAKSIGGSDTTVSAFALADGQVLWTYPGENIYYGNMAVGGSFVVVEGFDENSTFVDNLTVLDRATGAFLYRMELPLFLSFLDPVLVRDPATGKIVAYCSDGAVLVAVQIEQTGGQILWTQSGDFGSNSVPAIVGQSVIVVGSQRGYAFDRTTGAVNNFFVDSTSGQDSGAPVSYNAKRGEFYVKLDYFDSDLSKVLAFRYTDNDSIQLLWTQTTAQTQFGGGVSIGANDSLYTIRSGEVAVLNPADGSVVQSIPFPFPNGCSPILSRRVLWVYSNTQTYAYDAATLAQIDVFDGSPGFSLGYDPLGAVVSRSAVINTYDGQWRIDAYHEE